MIRNPKNPYPQNVTIDANDENNEISFIFSGDRFGAYRINIEEYNLNEGNVNTTTVFEGFPSDVSYVDNGYLYNNEEFKIKIKYLAGIWKNEVQKLENGKNYVWHIIMAPSFEGITANQETFTSMSYPFQTSQAPILNASYSETNSNTIEINNQIINYKTNTEIIINSRVLNILGFYDLNINPIKYYEVSLYDENNNLIDKTDKIFSSKVYYQYNGLIAEKKYRLKIYVISQLSQTLEIETYITPQYNRKQNMDYPPEVRTIEEEGCVELKWIKDSTALGEPKGEYILNKEESEVDITSGTIVYDNISSYPIIMDKDNFGLAIKTKINDKTTKILDYINNDIKYTIFVEDYCFYLQTNNEIPQKISQTRKDITFGIQNTNIATEDTGYMWWYEENGEQTQVDVAEDLYLLLTANEEQEFLIILEKNLSNGVRCLIKRLNNGAWEEVGE